MECFKMAGKVAVINGELQVDSFSGADCVVGRAVSILFCRMGVQVCLLGRNKGSLVDVRDACIGAFKECGREAEDILVLQFERFDDQPAEAAFNRCTERHKNIDILVNCNDLIISDALEDFSDTKFESCVNANIKDVVKMCQSFVPCLKKTRGTIVNVSSICGSKPFTGALSYCMAKAAINQFTRCLALDLAKCFVRVNAVSPSVVSTPQCKRPDMNDKEYAEFLRHAESTHPLARAGDSMEVAQAVAYLASEASSFTTGHVLVVDGGRSIMCPK